MEGMPAEVTALEDAIAECVSRPSRLPGHDAVEVLMGRRKYRENVSLLNTLTDKIITERLESGKVGEFGDVLDVMLTTGEKTTGEKLDLLNIRQQMLTFLAAGYDTTSGMLMFTVYYLIKNPDVLAKAYAEVDEVFGDDLSVIPDPSQIVKLKCLLQTMKEALRLWPVGAGFQLRPLQDTVIGGKYFVKKGQPLFILQPKLHRDPEVFPDPERFDPDRFTAENEAARPAAAWLPFGAGQRACIGRHFSFYEAQLLMGMILQRFELIDSFNYELDLKDFFSIKPQNFQITVEPRAKHGASVLTSSKAPARAATNKTAPAPTEFSVSDFGAGNTLLVLYGSNLGTAEKIANEIAQDGTAQGFNVTLGVLDDYVDNLPRDGAVIISTSSYNGNPPDNGVKFHEWLKSGLASDALAGVNFSVFGCGDRVWASTIPENPDRSRCAFGCGGCDPNCRTRRGRRRRRLRRHVPGLVREVVESGWRQAGARTTS